MPAPPKTPRLPRDQDVRALIGVLAVLEGEVMVMELDQQEPPEWMHRVAERLARSGLLNSTDSLTGLRQGLGDLNQRLRYVLGEYDGPEVVD